MREGLVVMGRAGGDNGGTEMELDKFGVGSIVEVNGNLYRNSVNGWVVLEKTLPAFMGGVVEYKVIHEVKKGPLDGFVKGDIISFESDYGHHIALKSRDDFWSVIGLVGEKTTAEMVKAFSPELVRKVGFSDGRG